MSHKLVISQVNKNVDRMNLKSVSHSFFIENDDEGDKSKDDAAEDLVFIGPQI